MTLLNVAPTKSSLLTLRHQLSIAEEGYDLLEQKRQILVFELMGRLKRAREVEHRVAILLCDAHSALREAALHTGSHRLDQTALAGRLKATIETGERHLMGLRIPSVAARIETGELPFGMESMAAHTEIAAKRFSALLPLLAELAELQNAVLLLARELRRTQRRCNALVKFFIPNYRQTINYIVGTLEERERESFVITRMIRDRLSPVL